MAQRKTGRIFGALALLAVLVPLSTAAGCKLFKKESKQFGEDCAIDTECESLECATYGSVCTRACSYDKDCGAGMVCRAKDAVNNSCAKPTGVPTGQSCNNEAECQSGSCLKPVGQDTGGFCSTHCDTEADCPEGHKTCLSISDSGASKFCLPGGGGTAAMPGTQEPPKWVAPRPVVKVVTSATATATATATAPASSVVTIPTGLHFPTVTASATATAAPTASATSTATTRPTATATSTTTKRPTIILKPKK